MIDPRLERKDRLIAAGIPAALGSFSLIRELNSSEQILGPFNYLNGAAAVTAGLLVLVLPAWRRELWLAWILIVAACSAAATAISGAWWLWFLQLFTALALFLYFAGWGKPLMFVSVPEGEKQAAADGEDDEDDLDDLDEDDDLDDEADEDFDEDDEEEEAPASVAELIDSAADDELCDRVFSRIAGYYGGDLDASELPGELRAVLLPYHAMGIIGNGGFNYLFEGNFRGDPYFHLTAAGFDAIGAKAAAAVFREALALFPDAKPPRDIGERLRHYRGGSGERRHEIDCKFWKADDEVVPRMAAFIRANRAAFLHLDGTPPPRETREEAREEPAEERSPAPDLGQLPHWARVAFAARCARRALPLFAKHWPDALPDRRRAVVRAIELAERSAAQGKAAEGLDEARMEVLVTAGAAMTALYGAPADMGGKEPLPADGNAGAAASFAAKAAEKAAEAAGGKPSGSAAAALEAFAFARDVGGAAVREALEADCERLAAAARMHGWTDRTPVPADVWKA
jgi:hypothetical protein